MKQGFDTATEANGPKGSKTFEATVKQNSQLGGAIMESEVPKRKMLKLTKRS